MIKYDQFRRIAFQALLNFCKSIDTAEKSASKIGKAAKYEREIFY